MEDLYRPDSVRLHSGLYFNFKSMSADSFTMMDVVIGLAREPRWARQSKGVVTVGQHTLRCYDLYPTFKMLLHDAPEAILGDVPSPMKKLLPAYREMEDRLYRVMCDKWQVDPEPDPVVKEIDQKVLEIEWAALVLKHDPDFYQSLTESQVVQRLKTLFEKHLHLQSRLAWN